MITLSLGGVILLVGYTAIMSFMLGIFHCTVVEHNRAVRKKQEHDKRLDELSAKAWEGRKQNDRV